MAIQQIQGIDSSPNQTWQVSVSINGGVSTFIAFLNYNIITQCWELALYTSAGVLILSSLPLVTGLNLLQQFQYLGIGSLYVVNASGVVSPNYPNSTDLGTDFVLVWGDNTVVSQVA